MDHAVFESEPSSADLLKAFKGFPEDLQGKRTVNRHKFRTYCIISSDQGDSKLYGNLAPCKLIDITLGVYNVTGRKNPYSVYFTTNAGTGVTGNMISVFATQVPYINLNILF